MVAGGEGVEVEVCVCVGGAVFQLVHPSSPVLFIFFPSLYNRGPTRNWHSAGLEEEWFCSFVTPRRSDKLQGGDIKLKTTGPQRFTIPGCDREIKNRVRPGWR